MSNNIFMLFIKKMQLSKLIKNKTKNQYGDVEWGIRGIPKIKKNYNNVKDIDRIINLINKSTNSTILFHIIEVLTNGYTIENGIALKGAELISNVQEKYQAECAKDILTYYDAIENGIALLGVELVSNAQEEYKAKYVRDMLRSSALIRHGIALEGAKLLISAKKEGKVQYEISDLTSEESQDARRVKVRRIKGNRHQNERYSFFFYILLI